MLPRTLYSVILPLLYGAPFILLHAKGRPTRSLSSIDPTPVPSSAPVENNLLDIEDKVDMDNDSVTPSALDSDSLALSNDDELQRLDVPSKFFPSSASFTLVDFPKLLEDVLQLNLNKAYNAGIDLLGKLNKTGCFLALLQEPYCYKGTLAAIPGRADYIPSARTGGPRAAIYADKRLKLREVTHLCTRDLAVGVSVIGNKQTLSVSAYMDINQNNALIKILEYRQLKRLGLILAMDSNAHSTLWGFSTNPRGAILTELITEYGLLLRNIGKEYTYDCQLGKSVIDLTLTCNLGAGILNWKVSKGLNFSDHNTIKFSIAAELLKLPPTRSWAKADWVTFI